MEQPQLDRLDFSKVSILQILPKEIVMHIICFLPRIKVAQICSVSKTMKELAEEDHVWKKILDEEDWEWEEGARVQVKDGKTNRLTYKMFYKRMLTFPITCQWEVKMPHFSKISAKRVYSRIFYFGKYKWRILVFPKGNDVPFGQGKEISIYIDVANAEDLPEDFEIQGNFSITLVHQDPRKTIKRESHHTFTIHERDRGFREITAKTWDPQQYCKDDILYVVCLVQIMREHKNCEVRKNPKKRGFDLCRSPKSNLL